MKNIRILSENFHCFWWWGGGGLKFSVYLNRLVFVMSIVGVYPVKLAKELTMLLSVTKSYLIMSVYVYSPAG